MDSTITLKHICREYKCDPYKLRGLLRKHNIPKPQAHWRWQPDDPSLERIRELASTLPEE